MLFSEAGHEEDPDKDELNGSKFLEADEDTTVTNRHIVHDIHISPPPSHLFTPYFI